MAIAWIPLCFLALAAQRLLGIRHTMYSVFSLVHFWDLSQRFVEASFILGAFPLHEPQKSKWQPAKFLEARMGCAWHWRKKGLLETNCVLKCSTHVCPSVVCLSAGGYMWMAGRMEQGEGVGN